MLDIRGRNAGVEGPMPKRYWDRSGGSLPCSRAFLSSSSLIFCRGSFLRGASSASRAGVALGLDHGCCVARGEGGSLGLPPSASIRAWSTGCSALSTPVSEAGAAS
jgi:hypothetical protein